MQKIAIIGAGLSGLTLANKLKSHGEVTVFEKSRGYGGRMATRRADPYAFDHGAQYFTAKSSEFKAFLEKYVQDGVVRPWEGKMVSLNKGTSQALVRDYPSYVAVPGMNALGQALSKDINVKNGVEISYIGGTPSQWYLHDKQDVVHGPFDWVISSAPAPQSLKLLPQTFAQIDKIRDVKMLPGFSLMLGFETPIELAFDSAFVEDSSIGYVAINSSKPERGNSFSIIVQSNNEWAKRHVDDDKEKLSEILFKELKRVTGINLPVPSHSAIHRWLYANVKESLAEPYLLDKANQLAICGDWCIRGRVEAAFESGAKLARGLITQLD